MIHFLLFLPFLAIVIYNIRLQFPKHKITEGKAKTLSTTGLLLTINCFLMAMSGNTWFTFGIWIFNSLIWFMSYRNWKKTSKIISTPSDSEDRIKKLWNYTIGDKHTVKNDTNTSKSKSNYTTTKKEPTTGSKSFFSDFVKWLQK